VATLEGRIVLSSFCELRISDANAAGRLMGWVVALVTLTDLSWDVSPEGGVKGLCFSRFDAEQALNWHVGAWCCTGGFGCGTHAEVMYVRTSCHC